MASVIRISYHNRLFLVLLAFSWTIISCFVGFQYLRERQYKSDILNARLQSYNSYLLETVENGLPYEDYIATHEPPFDELRISVITLSGAVVYDNMLPLDSLDNHRMRPEVANALRNGAAYHIGRQSASNGREYFYSATRGERVVVRTAVPYSASLRELLRADWTFLGIMIAISLAMSVLAFFVTRRLGKNIERLNRFAGKAEKGEPFDDDKMFPNDELGSISNHIVQLYKQWQQTIKDRDMAHEAAMREEQEKIRIKRQLSNNINHELKTPVASIIVCLDLIQDHPQLSELKKMEYLGRIRANAMRLNSLLKDVAAITRMDEGSEMIEKTDLDLTSLVKEIVEEESLKTDMHITIDMPEISISGNRQLLESIFRNLIDNAISYSGATELTIKADQSGNFKISDNGCGISSEHLPHIFERFYRVDKGRSRAAGGTGLGLAIVRNAIMIHGGEITVRSINGLTFDFNLKINKNAT